MKPGKEEGRKEEAKGRREEEIKENGKKLKARGGKRNQAKYSRLVWHPIGGGDKGGQREEGRRNHRK